MPRISVALAVLALIGSACTSGKAAGPAGPVAYPSPDAATVIRTLEPTPTPLRTDQPLPVGDAVTVAGNWFDPQGLEVPLGATLTWTNRDAAAHTATSGVPGARDGRFDGPLAGSGGKFSLTFTQPGTYPYFCAIHTSMVGLIVVKR